MSRFLKTDGEHCNVYVLISDQMNNVTYTQIANGVTEVQSRPKSHTSTVILAGFASPPPTPTKDTLHQVLKTNISREICRTGNTR